MLLLDQVFGVNKGICVDSSSRRRCCCSLDEGAASASAASVSLRGAMGSILLLGATVPAGKMGCGLPYADHIHFIHEPDI